MEYNLDYQAIFNAIGQCTALVLPVAIGWGLAERLVSFVLDAMLDRIRRTERI